MFRTSAKDHPCRDWPQRGILRTGSAVRYLGSHVLVVCSYVCLSLGGLAGVGGIAVHTPGPLHSPEDGFALFLAAVAFLVVGGLFSVIVECVHKIPSEDRVKVIKFALQKLPDPLNLLKLLFRQFSGRR